MLELISLLIFADMLLLFYIIRCLSSGRRNIYIRLQHYLNPEKEKEKPEKIKGRPWKEGMLVLGKTLGKSRWGSKYKEKIGINLVQAHLPLKPEEYIAINVITAISALAAAFILSENFPAAVLASAVAALVPGLYVKNRKRSIIHKIDQQLPDTIALLSNTLKAGYSFLQAVDAAAKELPAPISLEFQRILKEVNLGVNMEKALEELGKRVQSKDLELIIMAVLIQRQIGGNLSEILDNISETIRSRIKIKGEIRILTAQGRISGLIISLMPAALGIFLYIINPSYISLLFTEPLGMGMLFGALCMQGIGIFLIRKIIRIEV